MNLTKSTLFFLTLVCGFSVANLYYNQTLFVLIGDAFHHSVDEVSILSTATQIAYAAGLVLFVPLADVFSRKKLIAILLGVNAIMQLVCAFTPWFQLLLLGSVFIGVTTVAAQIVIPAITLVSPENQRGKNVGLLMSGLFSGIVFARLLSGMVGHYFGWRDVYLMSFGIDVALIVGTLCLFPAIPAGKKIPYFKLLGSLGGILSREPVLRRTCAYGALIFCSFSGLWGALDYLLSSPPYHYSSNIVGLFSLIGIFGVFSSNIIGRLADKHGVGAVLKWIPAAVILSFVSIGFSSVFLLFLIVGMIVLDTASRASLISNQLVNYTLSADMRSRVNTIFMSCYFIGGAIGTSIGSIMAVQFGWFGLAVFGILCAVLTYVLNGYFSKKK
jgi:predicted MFS family arabinose efflux permease